VIYPDDYINRVICGNTLTVLKTMPDKSVDCIVTSPPYWGLRDYGEDTKTVWNGDKDCQHKWIKHIQPKRRGSTDAKSSYERPSRKETQKLKDIKTDFCQKCGAWYGQLGLEPTLDLYLEHLLQITAELKRVLKKSGVMFWNHGTNYGSAISAPNAPILLKERIFKRPAIGISKCLTLQNWRLILRMIDEQGWRLRNSIIWSKPNAMPSSVKDRFTNKYEPVFMLVKNRKYHFDLDAVRIPHKESSIERLKYPIVAYGGNLKIGRFNRGHNIDLSHKFNYRVRDSEKKSEQCPQFKATKEEIERYKKRRPDEKRMHTFYGHSKRGKEFENIKGKNPGDLWTIPTQPCPREFRGIHFATFPGKLVEPMILSSCPTQICKKCGKARERIVKLGERIPVRKDAHFIKRGTTPDDGKHLGGAVSAGRMPPGYAYKRETIGFTKCNCENPEYEPGIVLDPFGGAGTVGVVAKRLGRRYILIDIKPKYCEMARKRIAKQVYQPDLF